MAGRYQEPAACLHGDDAESNVGSGENDTYEEQQFRYDTTMATMATGSRPQHQHGHVAEGGQWQQQWRLWQQNSQTVEFTQIVGTLRPVMM